MKVLNEAESTERDKNFAINQLIAGRSNAVGTVTLAAGTTTTTVAWRNGNGAAVPLLVPKTANAAAALATTYCATVTGAGFVLTHVNNAQTDRTFGFVLLGG